MLGPRSPGEAQAGNCGVAEGGRTGNESAARGVRGVPGGQAAFCGDGTDQGF